MKVNVDYQNLFNAISTVIKGVSPNSSDPIYGGICLEAKEGSLVFKSNNQNVFIKTTVPAFVELEGSCVVSGRILSNIVKVLPDAPVCMEKPGRTLLLSCDRAHFELSCMDVSNVFSFSEPEVKNGIELPYDLLYSMVEKVYRFTSKDISHQVLQGIYLNFENNMLRLVATDAFRLGICDTYLESQQENGFSVNIPGLLFKDLLSTAKKTDTVFLGLTQTQIVLEYEKTAIIMRRIEGEYPKYSQLLPSSCKTAVIFDTKNLLSVLKRASMFTFQNSSVRIDVDTDCSEVTISSKAQDQGESIETIETKTEGQSVSVALNYHYLQECLSQASDTDEIRMEILSSSQPVVFKSTGKINYLNLIMPMRL